MATIRNEVRLNEQGDAEVWANLGDILGWLDTLPSHTSSVVAAGAALEIKHILLEQFTDAEVPGG